MTLMLAWLRVELPFTGDTGARELRVVGIRFVPEAFSSRYDLGAWPDTAQSREVVVTQASVLAGVGLLFGITRRSWRQQAAPHLG